MALSRIKTWIAEILYAADLNAEFNNILNNALSLISPLTGNLDANSNRITSLAAASAISDAVPATSIINNALIVYTTTGTEPTYILTPSPAITAYAAGQEFIINVHSANASGAATINVSGLGAKNLYTPAVQPLAINELATGYYRIRYDGTRFVINSLKPILLQDVRTTLATTSSGSTAVPFDDTPPTSSEGTEILTLAIVPHDTGNILIIDFDTFLAASGANDNGVAFICQDATVNSLFAAGVCIVAAGNLFPVHGTHHMAAGTTSSTTFKLRVGSSGSTYYWNGTSAGRKYGGVMITTLRIRELRV